jgi:hypothetical protein
MIDFSDFVTRWYRGSPRKDFKRFKVAFHRTSHVSPIIITDWGTDGRNSMSLRYIIEEYRSTNDWLVQNNTWLVINVTPPSKSVRRRHGEVLTVNICEPSYARLMGWIS